jgi:AcrR family transcriptional regulator
VQTSAPTTDEPGLRDRNAKDRRDALVAAAYALFAEKGFAATTMDDVAARAGLSRRTAFRYFASKEDLVFPMRDARLAALEAMLVSESGETPFETVKRACLALARDYQTDHARMLAQWRIVEAHSALVARELHDDRASEAAIERAFLGDAKDTPRARRRARVRASAVVGAVRATLREWLEGGATVDLVRLGRETFAELEDGFGDGETKR